MAKSTNTQLEEAFQCYQNSRALQNNTTSDLINKVSPKETEMSDPSRCVTISYIVYAASLPSGKDLTLAAPRV